MQDGLAANRPERDEDVLLVLPPDRVVATARCRSWIRPDPWKAPDLMIRLSEVRWASDYAPSGNGPAYVLRFSDGTEQAGFFGDVDPTAVTSGGFYRFKRGAP